MILATIYCICANLNMCIYKDIRTYIYLCIHNAAYVVPVHVSYYIVLWCILYTRAKGIRLLWPLSMFIFQFWNPSRLGHEISGPVGPWASQPRDQNVAGMTSWTFASADPANCSVEPDLGKKTSVFEQGGHKEQQKNMCDSMDQWNLRASQKYERKIIRDFLNGLVQLPKFPHLRSSNLCKNLVCTYKICVESQSFQLNQPQRNSWKDC